MHAGERCSLYSIFLDRSHLPHQAQQLPMARCVRARSMSATRAVTAIVVHPSTRPSKTRLAATVQCVEHIHIYNLRL
jgi:hypothetical protein